MVDVDNHVSSDEDIKPIISRQEVEFILENFFGFRDCTIKELAGYDDLNYHCSPKINENPFISKVWPHGYVLKIMNSLDSKNTEICEAQNSMMLFLRDNNIPGPVPIKNVFGQYYVRELFPKEYNGNGIQKKHIVRLLEYQPGTVLKNVPKTYTLMYELGIFVSKINDVLKDFYHPLYEAHYSIWQLHSVPDVIPFTDVVKNMQKKRLVEEILVQFSQDIATRENTFEKGMIHGDFNEHNVLMLKSETGDWKVSAILDFGDSHLSCYLYELAISLCYMMFECKANNLDPIIGAGHLLAGYFKIRPNLNIDFRLLKLCICARICQSLILGLKAFSLHPENPYVLDSQTMGWPLLEELWEISEEKIVKTWESVINSYKIKA